jgi:cardiolipin synthase A/B
MLSKPMTYLDLATAALVLALALLSAGHALVYKRDSRAALGWIFVCLWLPLMGPFLYWVFGLNRIATRARRLDEERAVPDSRPPRAAPVLDPAVAEEEATPLARVSAAVTGVHLAAGNAVSALDNGEEAFPAMLAAIASAETSVYLCTYIFETNRTGLQFVDALAAARERGVRVRVIVDGVGEHYSPSRVSKLLLQRKVPVARFLPPQLWPPALRLNLRTHRKILTVDGRVGFTGGMNLGDRHLAARPDDDRVVDLHFRLEGPVVLQMEEAFRLDWAFVCGEILPPPAPVPASLPASSPATTGSALCRVIVDGPDENLDRLLMIYLGAISAAHHRIFLMTPYFLPPREILASLAAAAVRGVEVVVLLPEKNNLFYVHWATRKLLWEILQRGVRVFYQPPPFVHSKLFLVDDHYVLVGSANLDSRSLRLNFELNVEIYDRPLARELASRFRETLKTSHEVTLEEMDARSIPIRIRDALPWLFSPYL